MNEITVHVEKLGKLYRIGEKVAYNTLRDTIMNAVSAAFRRSHSASTTRHPTSTIWALKNISFEVKRGDTLGIIGGNGAGKSTLLRILSRITPPTEGYAEIYGQVGALLEVGTGFHPELTGRENIYLNGAVLGMTKVEVKRKFSEIVEFSEIGQFLDTPVKHYSSGMYVRLAFAIAVHLEPVTLIVDEVLAVGDVAFQKKCLEKMNDAARHGRTVIFVSHNMEMIKVFCSRTILLKHGNIEMDGKTEDVVRHYLENESFTV
jgi:lipopolysaccharide transport system ATP-binding protein